jgi:light-regulated signal transduction histidine kinase (bacteriophytochrome)
MDITSRKEGEKILAETARRLESSNQTLEAFAYSASHDLQEPLRKIIGFSNLLERSFAGELSDQGRDLIERMRNASQRMEKMIDSLLEFSRVSARPPALKRVALDDVLQNVLQDLEIRIQRTGGQVEVERLPAVQADPALMEHLFLNLIANALKFHRPDAPPQVRIYPVDSGSAQASIAVEDNGIGIEPEHAERIFMPFQRLHGKNAYEGSGLGLAISKMIVDQHGGQIRVQSQPGQGSTFLVDLPAAPEA